MKPTESGVKRLLLIRAAINNMRVARDSLRLANASKAADYVSRALKSVEGAERHAINRIGRPSSILKE